MGYVTILVPSHWEGGTLWFSPCLRTWWKGEVWGGGCSIPTAGVHSQAADPAFWYRGHQCRLSLCAVKQELKWVWYYLFLGAISLVMELALCAKVLAVLFPSLVSQQRQQWADDG